MNKVSEKEGAWPECGEGGRWETDGGRFKMKPKRAGPAALGCRPWYQAVRVTATIRHSAALMLSFAQEGEDGLD